MASIICTIDGEASSAYMKSGSPVGAPPTLIRHYNKTYRVACTADFSNYTRISISGYNDTNQYGISQSVNIISGSEYTWDGEYFYLDGTSNSFIADITFSEYPTHIYVDPYCPSGASFTFNGSTGYYGDGTGNYIWYISSLPPEHPTITAQPVILSVNPTNGASTTIMWSAATVNDQGNSTIYYQYFVGPNSTYSDSYHIGTTTGTSATITEAQIISKCGNGFGASSSGSTCYLFVRAYWDNGSTQGGWVVPTGTTFTYYPTINAPTNFSITPTTGSSTVLKWNNTKAGNNSDSQIILYIDNNQVASGIQGSNSGYTIGEDVWKTLGEGNHAIKIAHEYYGRYAYTSSLTFTYKKPYQTISYYTNGNFVPCKVFYYTNNEWRLCNINYYTDGSWKPCSTT